MNKSNKALNEGLGLGPNNPPLKMTSVIPRSTHLSYLPTPPS